MLTMLEAAKLMNNPLQQGVVEIFAANNPVLERLPFVDIQGNAYRYNREGSLPGIAFRGVNESYTESTGVLNPQTETLTICGGDSDYDVALVAMGTGSNDLRAAHDALKAKSLTLTWLKTYFDGDSTTEPREFDGLNLRLTGDQLINAGTGGATLTLDMVDELIDAVQGTPTVLLMNKTMRRKITKLAQNSTAVMMDRDALGRQMVTYAGIPIGIVEDDASGTAILGFDEDDGSSNLDTCSIYAVRFDLDGMHGIQTRAMDVRDLGEQDSKPVLRTRVEWYSGVVVKHPKAAARLYHINDAWFGSPTMYGPFDKQLELRDIADGAETATAAETGISFAARMAGDFKAVVYVSALDTADADETYTVAIDTDSVAAFSDSPVTVGSVTVTATGVYEIPLSQASIAALDADAAAIRCKVTIAGTSPSITYGCYLAPT